MSIAEAIGHFATFGLVLMMISMGMALSILSAIGRVHRPCVDALKNASDIFRKNSFDVVKRGRVFGLMICGF